ncbi:MAG: radical SAM protein [Actinomycetota bacterium]|nr:radical SAM protein [Actinomycetota bacterium]
MALHKITRKTLLYKSGVEYADYALNHAEGCTHGCTYPCYAMMMKKRCGVIASYEDWVRPKIVENALELLDKELPRLKSKIMQVFMCFTTDPFMYEIEEVNHLTLQILQRFNKDKVKGILITKGVYPDCLIDRQLYNEQNEYGVSLVSIDEEFREKHEPFSAPYEKRIEALRNLHDAGLKTWVSIEPYPTPNIFKQDIRELLERVSFVDKIVFGKWNYSRLTTAYSRHREFYNSMALEVASFCEHHLIQSYIKAGTISPTFLGADQSVAQAMLAKHLVCLEG